MAGEDRLRPVELLRQHHPHQPMRPGHRAERQAQIARSSSGAARPSGPPIRKAISVRRLLPPVARAGARRPRCRAGGRARRARPRRRLRAPTGGAAAPPRRGDARAERCCAAAARPGGAARESACGSPRTAGARTGAIAADRGHGQSRRAPPRARRSPLRRRRTTVGARAARAPELLQVVEAAGLVLEEMDDDVAGVDQDPVGLPPPSEARALSPAAFRRSSRFWAIVARWRWRCRSRPPWHPRCWFCR